MAKDKFVGVHPELVKKIHTVLVKMDEIGSPMFVVSGVRTDLEQQELYAIGRTKPGRVVTNCDGILKKSNHQMKADGFGHAVDCAFVGDHPFDDSHPWGRFGEFVEAAGLEWGGRWKSKLIDRPHAELITDQ